MSNDVSYFKINGDNTRYAFNDSDLETTVAALTAADVGALPDTNPDIAWTDMGSDQDLEIHLRRYGTGRMLTVTVTQNGTTTANHLISSDGTRNWVTPAEIAVSSASGSSAITLNSAYSAATVTNVRAKKTGSVVALNIIIASLSLSAGENTIGTIASGYRPDVATYFAGYIGNASVIGTPVRGAVASDGTLTIYVAEAASGSLRTNCTFIIG